VDSDNSLDHRIAETNIGKSRLGDAPANLSISEFLNLYFRMEMETGGVLLSKVFFYPSDHQSTGIVLMVQTWHDEGVSQINRRRDIRKWGDLMVERFKRIMKEPTVTKRWHPENPTSNFIIRHVRVSDVCETLAVTINGVTHFDPQSIQQAEVIIISRGGVWP